jgi:hypothetical protein
MDPAGERFGAGRLDCGEAVGQHRREDLDHLTVAVVGALQHVPNAFQAGRQQPSLEGGSVAQRAGFSGEHRHVMPGIVERRAAAEAAPMFADDRAVLARIASLPSSALELMRLRVQQYPEMLGKRRYRKGLSEHRQRGLKFFDGVRIAR